jgi:hypothetical protein
MHKTGHSRGGVLTLIGECDHPDLVLVYGRPLLQAMQDMPNVRFDRRTGIFRVDQERNAYVRSGLRSALQREFGIGGTAVTGIGVASNTSAVTFDTRFLNGASAGLNGAVSGQNVSIKAINPAASIVTDGAGVTQVVTAGVTWTNADFFNNIPFVWNKLGLTLAVPASNTSEVDGNLVDVIGGTGGSSPYNKTFSMDLTAAGTFSVTGQIAVTASAA